MTTKIHNFEAETGRILELLTHSIYSNKEIFLRELISNASDAIDKARIKSLTDTSYLKEGEKFEIKVSIDEKNNLIIIEDNGIGMSEKELHANLGTIAKSGTKEFLDKLKKAKEDGEHNLIGQFGVGFYSSFMVASKVEVETKSSESKKAYTWSSDGKNSYEVGEGSRKDRGTTIKLYIDEANKDIDEANKDFITEWKLRELIKKYSNYVGVPIMLELEDKEFKDGKEIKKGKKWEQVNETKAIWKKSKSEIKKEELEEFYKSISMDFNTPLTHTLVNTEGLVSYKSLLFIPKEKNMFADLSDPNREYGPKLYIQNVLILEHAKELLPVWLRFVSGVVETSDLPLNISREMLQSNTTLDKIKKGLTKKVLAELKKTMNNNEEDYNKFLENYSRVLKEGIYYEADLKDEIAEVLKFDTLLSDKKISLDAYLTSSQPSPLEEKEQGQKEEHKCEGECENCECEKESKTIYYIVGKSKSEVLASPYLTQFRENKVDVILLTDPIDEWVIQTLREYKGNKLKSVTSSDIKLKEETKEEKKKKEETKKDFEGFLELTKNTIGVEKIEKVELNENLGDAIGALKTPEGAMTPQMEKMMKAMGQPVPSQKRILELNPNTQLVQSMKDEFSNDMKSDKLSEMIKYAYNQAILLEGGELENIAEFVSLTNKFAGEYLK
ncbi:MAG: molecular chaperone HtpG [Candidatus Gracilibacteria bacterium]|nr:molecular chaperone HtpG [Candidatus Gracilibacteria bacterium]